MFCWTLKGLVDKEGWLSPRFCASATKAVDHEDFNKNPV